VLVVFVWPWGNRNSADLRDRYEKRSDVSRVAPGQFPTSGAGSKVFFIEKGSDEAMNARGVFVLTNGEREESLTSARSAHLENIDSDRFLVLGGGNLLLLALGLAATNPRRASNWNLLFALLAFVVYFNLINLSQSWVANGRFAMGPALLALHGGAFVLALSLIWWREHGTVRGPRRRPAKAAAA
jgi:lipopolysaccharide export system permease protein